MALGLSGDDPEGAYLGLGSTYRCLGDYQNSKRILEKGVQLFPDNGALKTFLAMTLFNLQNHSLAMEILIKELVKSSNDQKIQIYQRALLNYSDKLSETFD
ncbi:MAG: tetratricopeptide repeat protein [Bdellovibrionaceae bacterium]|nr:tetratricopeptide repeat protein [Pseudobdellovibrionaceae bacterium]